MTDIVERLRAEADFCPEWETADRLRDAADEIERLRAVLAAFRSVVQVGEAKDD